MTIDDSEFARRAPAIWANRFYLMLQGGLARLAFGEVADGPEPIYHAAVRMMIDDLKQLRDLISLLIAQHEAKAEAAPPPDQRN